MIYKVFYQENKDRNLHREKTKVIYLEVEASNELEGRIKTRKLVEEKHLTMSNLSNFYQKNTWLTKKKQVPLN